MHWLNFFSIQLYFFTVEFGLCKQDGQIKAYGAALLSAYGELRHAMSDKPERRPLEPVKTAVQPFQDEDYQPIYFLAESFDDVMENVRWVENIQYMVENLLSWTFVTSY